MKEAAKLLFPPGVPAVARWRLAIAATIVVLCLFALWTLGAFKQWGFGAGFAHTEELLNVATKQDAMLMEQLDTRLLQMRTKWCEAIRDRNQDKKYYAQQLKGLELKYKQSFNADWHEPDCDEL